MSEIMLAPLDRSSWIGIFWPAYNRGSLWLLNAPEALYHLGGSERRACHQPELTWRWESGVLRGRMDPHTVDSPVRIEIEMQPDAAGVGLTLRVANTSKVPFLEEAVFGACLRHNAAWRFSDTTGDRTFVRRGGRWTSLREMYGSDVLARSRDISVDRPGAEIEAGIMARVNETQTHVVAFSWDRVHNAASNLAPAISCTHSDPALTALPPGESAIRRGRLWFGKWGLDELWGLCVESGLTGKAARP